MKKVLKLALASVLAMTLVGNALAAEAPAATKSNAVVVKKTSKQDKTTTSAKDKATTASKKKAKLKELGNQLCPIGKHEVGSMQKGSFVEYNGYKVGLCCNGCSKKFLSDPETYFKVAQESVKK